MKFIKENLPNIKFYGLLLIAGLVGTYLTYNYWIAFSDYFITLLFVVLFAGLFHWYDVNALKTIDTLDEIKKGNTAVSQFLIAVALLLLAVATIVG